MTLYNNPIIPLCQTKRPLFKLSTIMAKQFIAKSLSKCELFLLELAGE